MTVILLLERIQTFSAKFAPKFALVCEQDKNTINTNFRIFATFEQTVKIVSDHKIIGKLSIWIINLIVIILALVFVIVYLLVRDSNPEEKKEEAIAFCGTEDPMDKAYTNLEIADNLFKAKCAACHRVDDNTTGPKLAGVFDRIPDHNWFNLFIQQEDSLIKSKDKYLLEKKKYAPEIDFRHAFKELNATELKRLRLFILINE